MKIFYWRERKNFGDLLTKLLIKKFTGLNSTWAKPEHAELVMVGSLIHHLPKDFHGVIAGSGKLFERTKMDFPNANILGVRGPLTAKDVKKHVIWGDPGLLADELVGYQDKTTDIGIVPHWSDTDLEHRTMFYGRKWTTKVIRVDDDPLKVIRQIGSCRKIVSSSLHGIILADAFNIPRRIEIAPNMLKDPYVEGGLFKWHDYSGSIQTKLEIGKVQQIDPFIISDKQHELYDLLQKVKKIFA